MRMLNAQTNELPKEDQDSHLHNLEVLEQLEKEGFMEAEEQLWLRISVAIENRKQKNKELKQEVEQLRSKCDELTRVLNRNNISQL